MLELYGATNIQKKGVPRGSLGLQVKGATRGYPYLDDEAESLSDDDSTSGGVTLIWES